MKCYIQCAGHELFILKKSMQTFTSPLQLLTLRGSRRVSYLVDKAHKEPMATA